MTEKKCSICKVKGFLEVWWCPLAAEDMCPMTTLAQPTAEMRQQLKMDEKREVA